MQKFKTMKRILLYLIVFASLTTNAQVGIGVAGTDVAASAQLEVKSTTKGLLIPRLTESQKTAVSNPATGLMIYQTDGTSGFYFYNGSSWSKLVSASSSSSTTHAIGDNYGGGIVFHTWDNGAHGLIVAKNEIGANGPQNFTSTTGIKWGTNGDNVGSFRNGFGGGKGNTDIIIAKTSNSTIQYYDYAYSTAGGYAALFAAQYMPTVASGEQAFGDWYLPSIQELMLLIDNSYLFSGSGYNSSHDYWSSTEVNAGYAYRGRSNGPGFSDKPSLNFVLPIRQF